MAASDSFILTYHSLDDSGSVISVTPELFRWQMRALRESGRPVVPLEVVTRTQNAVALTFDDGYVNYLEHAAPVLAECGFPSTIFVVSRMCGKKSAWPGAGEPRPLMNWPQLRGLPDGATVGAHTATHADLRTLPPERAAGELDECRRSIEQETGRKPSTFAYPYGAANEEVRRLAAGRFDWCCGVVFDYIKGGEAPDLLPRLDVYYFRSQGRFADLMAGRARKYVAARRWMREVRGMVPFARF